ncbi:MAG: hypothetical protein K2K91_06010 [Ruminococcus sp.]|nr:hypothetical protein [Ruminococcus sp.]
MGSQNEQLSDDSRRSDNERAYLRITNEAEVNTLTSAFLGEKQALYKISQHDEERFYKINNKTIDELLAIAGGERPFYNLMLVGEHISMAEYAEIQQSDKFTFSVEMDFDYNTALVYTVNNGLGGIDESNRTDNNVSFETVNLAQYNIPIQENAVSSENNDITHDEQLSFFGSSVPITSEKKTQNSDIDKNSDIIENNNKINYRFSEDFSVESGAKSKYHANVEAIKTLKTLEKENRIATSEEQEILAHYVGWGGITQAFDERNEKWSKEYIELKELLTPDEYRSARASVRTAFYTESFICR